jgi:hypothetical protein
MHPSGVLLVTGSTLALLAYVIMTGGREGP